MQEAVYQASVGRNTSEDSFELQSKIDEIPKSLSLPLPFDHQQLNRRIFPPLFAFPPQSTIPFTKQIL
jgi:hypothetical protein